MVDDITVQFAHDWGTPVFLVKNDDPELARVIGFRKKGRTGLATFPAFFPFVDRVVDDLRLVYKDRLQWTDEAQTFLDELPALRKAWQARSMPKGFLYVTDPFDHQIEGVERAFHEYRTALFFDCGLGKTKTAIDLIRAIKQAEPGATVLVTCPPTLPHNWRREIDKHAGGELSVMTLANTDNSALPVQTRHDMYTGTRDPDTDPDSWVYQVNKDLLYTPLDVEPVCATSKELLKLERAYLDNVCADGDVKERTSIRGKMGRRAKKIGVELTPYARMLAPKTPPANAHDVVIVSHSLLWNDVDYLANTVSANAVIVDESHAFRTKSSNRSKALLRVAKHAKRRHLLSGTPTLGDPMHLFVQLFILAPWLTDAWYRFRKRYVVLKETTMGPHTFDMPVGYKSMSLLNEIVNEVAVRKKASECLDLPPVRIVDHYVDVGPKTREVYNDFIRNWGTEMGDQQMRVAHAADRLTKLFQTLSGFFINSNKNYELCNDCPHLMNCVANRIAPYTPECKVEQAEPPKETVRIGETDRRDSCLELVDSIMAGATNKVIIWCAYTEELDMIEEGIQAHNNTCSEEDKWGYVRVDGATKDKIAAEDAFQADDDNCRIYLSQIATGIGITLTAANYMIYYSVTFDLEHYEQSSKRADRIGQTRPLTIYHMITEGSVNEYIFRSLRKKVDISATLTDHIRCATCEREPVCAAANIKPFDEDCVYSDTDSRVTTQPKLLR